MMKRASRRRPDYGYALPDRDRMKHERDTSPHRRRRPQPESNDESPTTKTLSFTQYGYETGLLHLSLQS
eukprot:7149908-Prymnesium_polylepis.4